MKSTITTILIYGLDYDKYGNYQFTVELPDFEALANAQRDTIEFFEKLEALEKPPVKDDGSIDVDQLEEIAEEHFVDEPSRYKLKRLYAISHADFQKTVCEQRGWSGLHEAFEDEEIGHVLHDSVQPSFCRNCGAEGEGLEPDAHSGWCYNCGQNALRSIAVILGVI